MNLVVVYVAIAALIIVGIVIGLIMYNKKEKFVYSYKNIYNIPQFMLTGSPQNNAYDDLKKRVDGYEPMENGKDADGNSILKEDEVYMKICCQLALRAASLGNFGIGCVIVDPLNVLKPKLQDAYIYIDNKRTNYLKFIEDVILSLSSEYTTDKLRNDIYLKKIVGIGLNQLFNHGFFENKSTPHVRSDRHGEMVAMDLLEDAISSTPYEKEFQVRMPQGLKLYTQLESCPMCMSRLASSSISAVYHGGPDNGGGMVHKLCSLPPIFIGLTNVQKFAPAKVSGNVKGDKKNSLIQLCFDCFGLTVGVVGTKQNERAYGCPDKCPDYNYCLPMADKDMFTRSGYDLSGFIRY